MKKIIFFLSLQLIIAVTYSQIVPGLENVRLFTITGANSDTIQFIKTNADIKQKKPTIIFLQGSLPIPLIVINETEGPYIASLSFNYWKICEKYNLIEISMPHTPPIVTRSKLNSEYQYLPDLKYPAKYDPLFLRDNQLEKYVERANYVIKFLKKQPWVDANRIAVIGHSQGSYIAAELGRVNKSVKAIGYFAGNPDGRFTQYIREFRRNQLTKQITPEEAQSRINSYCDKWESYFNGFDRDNMGLDNVKSWVSFSLSSRENLVKMKTPIFIAYGTKDLEHADGCDLLPIYFEMNGKKNYKMMPFVGCGHNFEEISSDGKHNWEKMHWQEAIDGFIEMWENMGNKTSPLPISVFDDDTYVIKSVQSDSCIDIPQGRIENGLELKLWKTNYGTNQKWFLKKSGDYFKFISRLNNQALSVSNDSIGNYKIIQEHLNDADNQLWKINKQGLNYSITSKSNEYFLNATKDIRELKLSDPKNGNSAVWNILSNK
jgi:hypothetical protein